MIISEKLQIIIPTYNRASFLKRTLEYFLEEKSPIRECQITILDNCSDDETPEISKDYSAKFENIKYIRNRYNIGADASIAKAYEMADHDYLWVCGDDEVFFWENWQEVEDAIKDNNDAIIIARTELRDEFKDNPAAIVYQGTLISSVIIATKNFNGNILRGMYNNTAFLLQHLIPLISLVNQNKRIYVVDKPVVVAGSHIKQGAKDISYTRGNVNEQLNRRTQTMSWLVGFCNLCAYFNDKQLAYDAIKFATTKKLGGGQPNYKWALSRYKEKQDLMQLIDIYLNINPNDAKKMEIYIMNFFAFENIVKSIFMKIKSFIFDSYKNETRHYYKVCGIKISVKRKHVELNIKNLFKRKNVDKL